MTVYNDLPAEDQAIIDNLANLVRAAIGAKAKGWNHTKAVADDTNAVGLVTALNAGQTIPNKSGLAGADSVTREELIAAYNLLNNDRVANDTPANRAAMAKLCGINAMLGV